eukprot:tig00020554_g10914.t1
MGTLPSSDATRRAPPSDAPPEAKSRGRVVLTWTPLARRSHRGSEARPEPTVRPRDGSVEGSVGGGDGEGWTATSTLSLRSLCRSAGSVAFEASGAKRVSSWARAAPSPLTSPVLEPLPEPAPPPDLLDVDCSSSGDDESGDGLLTPPLPQARGPAPTSREWPSEALEPRRRLSRLLTDAVNASCSIPSQRRSRPDGPAGAPPASPAPGPTAAPSVASGARRHSAAPGSAVGAAPRSSYPAGPPSAVDDAPGLTSSDPRAPTPAHAGAWRRGSSVKTAQGWVPAAAGGPAQSSAPPVPTREWQPKVLARRTGLVLTPTCSRECTREAHARTGAAWLHQEAHEHGAQWLRHDRACCGCDACRLLAARPEDPEKLLERQRALEWRRRRAREARRYCAATLLQACGRSFVCKLRLWRFRRVCRAAAILRHTMATSSPLNALRAAQLRVRACLRIRLFTRRWFASLPALRAKYAFVRRFYVRWRAALLLRKFRDVSLELRRRTIAAQIKVAAVYRCRLARAAVWRARASWAAVVVQAVWRSHLCRLRRRRALDSWAWLMAAYRIQKWWKTARAQRRLSHLQRMLDGRVTRFWLIIRYGRRWLRRWREASRLRSEAVARRVAKSWIRRFRLRRLKHLISYAYAKRAADNAELRAKMEGAAARIQRALRDILSRRRETRLHIVRMLDAQHEIRRAIGKRGFFAAWPMANADRAHAVALLHTYKREIRLLFLHYSLFGTQTAERAVQLLFPRFLAMLEAMELVGRGPNLGGTGPEGPQPVDRGTVLSIFVACNRDLPFQPQRAPQRAVSPSPPPTAEGSESVSRRRAVAFAGGLEERAAGEVRRSSVASGKSFADGKGEAMSLEALVEGLLRAAFAVYPCVASPAAFLGEGAERLRRFLVQHVKPLADRCWLDAPWRQRVADGVARPALAVHDPGMRRLFRKGAREEHRGGCRLGLAEFLYMVQGRGLIGAAVSFSAAIKAFVHANRDELERFLETEEPGVATQGLCARMQMDYDAFVEGVCRCAEAACRDEGLTEQGLSSFLRKLLAAP